MYQYRAFGLDIESEVPLELAAPAEFRSGDVSIRYGSLGELRERHGLASQDRRFLVDDGTAVLHWSSVGTVAVEHGVRITVDSPAGVDLRLLSMALSGPPLGILLHQRGDLVLHASAVVIEGGVATFVGHKGFGKSTTAAALHEAGFDLFTDDILSVRFDGPAPEAYPGFAQLKLWPSAVEAVFADKSAPSERSAEKQVHRMESAYRGDPLPVKGVFVLDAGDLGIERIDGREALLEILRNLYASRFVGTEGTPPDTFRRCVDLVQHVPVYRLKRKPGLGSLPDIVEMIARTAGRGGAAS